MPEKQILAKKTYVDNNLNNVVRNVNGVVSIPNARVDLSQKIVTTTEEDPDTHEEITTDEVVTESYLDRTKLHVEDSYASKTAEYGVNEISLNGSTITGITDNASGSSSTLAVSQRALSNFKQVEANPVGTPTADLTTIKIDNTIYELDAGTNVTITPTITEGTKIADYSIDGVDGELYTTDTDDSVELTTAEYNALPQSEKMNGTTYLLTDANPGGGGGSSIDYSTTEQDTGIRWIDGSPIYQKTIYYAGGSSGGRYNIPHGVENLDKLIYLEGFYTDSSGDNPHMILPRIATDGYHIGINSANNTYITMTFNTVWGSRLTDVYITIRYTKTTE